MPRGQLIYDQGGENTHGIQCIQDMVLRKLDRHEKKKKKETRPLSYILCKNRLKIDY